MNPISNLLCPQLPFFPSFSFPPSFHRAPTPCQLWGHKDRHGPSRTQESAENRLVKVTQIQIGTRDMTEAQSSGTR